MQRRQHSIYLMAHTKGLMTPVIKKRKIFKGFEGNGDIILGLLSWGSNPLKPENFCAAPHIEFVISFTPKKILKQIKIISKIWQADPPPPPCHKYKKNAKDHTHIFNLHPAPPPPNSPSQSATLSVTVLTVLLLLMKNMRYGQTPLALWVGR